jgi:predicted nucleotide-binding protein (sugar kinase/HSP70/actin superfamily)
VSDICAGLAYSIVNNYLEKVVGSRPLGGTIVFQGGVASNDAVVAAFEMVTGRAIHVHPYNRLSGAIGAALAAIDATADKRPSRFRELDATDKPSLRSFECRHCSNRCEVNVVKVRGERAFFGDTCERYTSRTAATNAPVPPNLAEEYVARCESAFGGDGGLKIGIPRASILFDSLVFWASLFKSLGHTPLLSTPSSEDTLTLGLKHLSVGVCLPIKLAAGHVHSLVARGVDLEFFPSIVRLPGDEETPLYSCPYAMAAPFIVGTSAEMRLLAPIISLHDEEAFLDGFEPHLELLQATREQLREAWHEAVRAQQEVDAEFRRRATALIAGGQQRYTFAILGKPYNTLDAYLNLSFFERLRRLGVLAIPQRFLSSERRGAASDLPWRFSADIEIAVQAMARNDDIHPVVISNFGCGPDAFTFKRIERILRDKPHLILEFDEHRGEAGVVTRIEAFLDQLDASRRQAVAGVTESVAAQANIPPPGSVVYIPCFADHTHAFAGLLRLHGCETHILPPPTATIRALGEKHSLGKECHAYSVIAGDLIELSRTSDGKRAHFFFPGTGLPCLLHEYGRGMRALLRQLSVENVTVCSPTGAEVFETFTIDALERFYLGLLSIELLVKAVCQTRPYEREKGLSDAIHAENLLAIENAVAEGNVLQALDSALSRVAAIPVEDRGGRPVVGMAGDIYTKSNPSANQDLVRWLEEQGLEVWPSPFQIDLVDFGMSRNLSRSVETLDVAGLLLHGSLAADRAIQQWRVRRVVGSRITRQEEPGYLEMKKLTAPYMPNESHELLFINVAKVVDFARGGADGIINAICFNCMVGNASAAITEKIRRDYDGLPIITAVYSGGEDPSRRMTLEAFVAQVIARYRRRKSDSVPPRMSMLGRFLARLPSGTAASLDEP